jgi:hypothetical protein
MRAQLVAFGSIEIDGRLYDHDVVLDQGAVHKRSRNPRNRTGLDMATLRCRPTRRFPGAAAN